MPLRDHFRSPISKHSSWEGFHGFWPGAMVRELANQLPQEYMAEPRVEQYEYEVLIFKFERERSLVAAIEIVSPANKEPQVSRKTLVAKCASLLQKGVCVSIVDLVEILHANLYADLLTLIGCADPNVTSDPPSIYAVTCRAPGERRRLEAWSHALALGQPLPSLPIWLTADTAVPLNLEICYEETCRVLRIRA